MVHSLCKIFTSLKDTSGFRYIYFTQYCCGTFTRDNLDIIKSYFWLPVHLLGAILLWYTHFAKSSRHWKLLPVSDTFTLHNIVVVHSLPTIFTSLKVTSGVQYIHFAQYCCGTFTTHNLHITESYFWFPYTTGM